MASHPELEFFNSLSGQLEIELDTPAVPIGDLENVRAEEDAKIVRIKMKAEVFIRETDEFRPLTTDEWASIAFRGGSIRLKSEEGDAISHDAPNGKSFTVRELLQAVEETERQTRAGSEWFGGVDVHHVFFEGIHADADGVWEIYWGS